MAPARPRRPQRLRPLQPRGDADSMPRSGISPFRALFLVCSLAALLPAPSTAGEAPTGSSTAPGSAAAPAAATVPIELLVDATDARRGLFHSPLALPPGPGPLSPAYPHRI